jgi:hypothetical protein
MLPILDDIFGSLANPVVMAVVIGTAALVLVLAEVIRRRHYRPTLRELPPYEFVTNQLGRVVESGGRVHISTGPTGIGGENTAITVAAVAAMREVASSATVSDKPPVVTTSDATTLPLMSDVLYRTYQRRSATARYERSSTRLVALDRVTLAGALTTLIWDDTVESNVLLGSFTEELALVTETGQRKRIGQTAGSDRIEGVAAAYPSTEHTLIGEELFVAPAYMNEPTDADLAGVITNDILRVVLIGAIIVGTVMTSLGVLQ